MAKELCHWPRVRDSQQLLYVARTDQVTLLAAKYSKEREGDKEAQAAATTDRQTTVWP